MGLERAVGRSGVERTENDRIAADRSRPTFSIIEHSGCRQRSSRRRLPSSPRLRATGDANRSPGRTNPVSASEPAENSFWRRRPEAESGAQRRKSRSLARHLCKARAHVSDMSELFRQAEVGAKSRGWLVVHTVLAKQSQLSNSLLTGKITGNFSLFGLLAVNCGWNTT